MKNMNICHDFRYGKIMYNVLDEYVGKSLKLYGEYSQGEADLFDRLIKPGDCIVEAGANIGSLTIHLAQLAGDTGVVWAFEPQRLVFQLLAGNMALNGLTNVHCEPKGLSDTRGTMRVPVLQADQAHNWGGTSLAASGETDGELVEIITVDSMGLARCDLLKIDVEGMSIQVLRGARQTIKRCCPIIYLEREKEHWPEVMQFMHQMGYKAYVHDTPLYNASNYFNNQEDVFTRIQIDEQGNRVEAHIVSFNALCLHQESGIKVEGFKEILA